VNEQQVLHCSAPFRRAGEMVALNPKTLDLAVFRQRGGRKYAQVQIP
jgi:hypothetical protein